MDPVKKTDLQSLIDAADDARIVVENGRLVLQLTKNIITVSPDVTFSITYVNEDDAQTSTDVAGWTFNTPDDERGEG